MYIGGGNSLIYVIHDFVILEITSRWELLFFGNVHLFNAKPLKSLCFLSVFLNSLPFTVRLFMNTHMGRTWILFRMSRRETLGSFLPQRHVAHRLDKAPLPSAPVTPSSPFLNEKIQKLGNLLRCIAISFTFQFLVKVTYEKDTWQKTEVSIAGVGGSRLKCPFSCKREKLHSWGTVNPSNRG